MAYLKFKFVDRAWNFCIRVQLFPPKTGFFKSKDANFWTECKQTETMRTLSASKATHCSKHTFSTFQTSSLWKFFFHPFPHTNSWRIDPHPGTPLKKRMEDGRDENYSRGRGDERGGDIRRRYLVIDGAGLVENIFVPFLGMFAGFLYIWEFCPHFLSSMVSGAAIFLAYKENFNH